MDNGWDVYILECSDGSFYTGITRDIVKRLAAHKAGKGSKYVASRLPFQLVYKEEAKSKSAALKREIAIKKMSHRQKAMLMAQGHKN